MKKEHEIEMTEKAKRLGNTRVRSESAITYRQDIAMRVLANLSPFVETVDDYTYDTAISETMILTDLLLNRLSK